MPRHRNYRKVLHRAHDFRRRAHGIAEEVYGSKWEKLNERQPGLNGGFGYLELLLNDSRWAHSPFLAYRLRGEKPLKPWRGISKRDAMVAASVIQWLGTNCGKAFMDECEKEIDRQKKILRAEEKRKHTFKYYAKAMVPGWWAAVKKKEEELRNISNSWSRRTS